MDTHNIISTPEITSNIGICRVQSERYSIGMFRSETTVVNSCTGEIVSQHQFYDASAFLAAGMIVAMLAFLVGAAIVHVTNK